MGLDMGEDDYVTKPSFGITVSLLQSQAYKNGKSLALTSVEFRLLCLFMRNPNHVLSKDVIYEQQWDHGGDFVDDNALRVYIRRLRLKIEDDLDHPAHIVTVRGFGCKWSVGA